MLKYGLGILLAVVSLGAAEPQAAAGWDVVMAKGSGVLTVGGVRTPITSFVYTHVASGQTGFNFPIEHGAIGLWGGSDLQPNAEHYILLVDNLRHGDAAAAKEPAKGRCEAYLSADGQIFHTLKCKVASDFGDITVDFKGDGKPVSVTHY